MPKSNILKSLEELEQPDIYSLLLFSIYKLYDVPEYSTLSELVYTLDKKNLYNFLSMYGGLTIKVPTLQELQKMLDALLLYQLIHFEKMESKDALKQFSNIIYPQKELLERYKTLEDVLSQYNFKQREESEDDEFEE